MRAGLFPGQRHPGGHRARVVARRRFADHRGTDDARVPASATRQDHGSSQGRAPRDRTRTACDPRCERSFVARRRCSLRLLRGAQPGRVLGIGCRGCAELYRRAPDRGRSRRGDECCKQSDAGFDGRPARHGHRRRQQDCRAGGCPSRQRQRSGPGRSRGVSGPFHTEGVASAAVDLREALDSVDIRRPRVPVISNVTGRPYGSPGEIRELLVTQLTHPVRWRESVEYLWAQGARDFVDFGPGKVVAGLATRITRNLKNKEVPVGA